MKQDDCCSIEKCDVLDFMSNTVGMTVLHPGGLSATRQMAEACQIGPQTRVLDNACGSGSTAVYLAQKYGCQVVGVDISKEMVAQATALVRQKGLERQVSFREADALALPFSADEFDVVVSQAMLILVSDKKQAVREALRVTRPGGRLGWIELSWKQPPTSEFLQTVSDVLCGYCMLNAQTFHGWETLFLEAGARQLKTMPSASMQMSGMRGWLADEGLLNASRIMYRYLANDRIRKRMDTMRRVFKENSQYFGYGIYLGQK